VDEQQATRFHQSIEAKWLVERIEFQAKSMRQLDADHRAYCVAARGGSCTFSKVNVELRTGFKRRSNRDAYFGPDFDPLSEAGRHNHGEKD